MNTDTGAIWNEMGARLRASISRRVNDARDVDDILQEVFLRIHRRIDSVDQAHRVEAWVYQIVRNAIVDHYRVTGRRQHETTTDAPPEETSTAHLDMDDEDAGVELTRCLDPMLEQLPAEQLEALTLTGPGGMTQAAAAVQLGLSVSGLKSRVQRGRRALRSMLLDCCHVQLDQRGGVMDAELRCDTCNPCAGDDDS